MSGGGSAPFGSAPRHAVPDRRTDVRDLHLLAVDLETTGLDPARDQILAIGSVPVDGLTIDLAGAREDAVHPEGPVGPSAAFHGLTDDRLRDELPIAEVLPLLLDALDGRVLLAHHARIEVGFLAAACRRIHGAAPPFTVVDTVELQRRVLGRRWLSPQPEELRLDAARNHFGLPRYRAHEALTDALACAELYLAQVAHLAGDGRLPLSRIRRRLG